MAAKVKSGRGPGKWGDLLKKVEKLKPAGKLTYSIAGLASESQLRGAVHMLVRTGRVKPPKGKTLGVRRVQDAVCMYLIKWTDAMPQRGNRKKTKRAK